MGVELMCIFGLKRGFMVLQDCQGLQMIQKVVCGGIGGEINLRGVGGGVFL